MNDPRATAPRPTAAAHILVPLAAALCLTACAQTPPTLADLPLFQLTGLAFAGAFRLPTGDVGASTIDCAEGPIALGPDATTLYIVGHAHHQAIAEYVMPPLGADDGQGPYAYAPLVLALRVTGGGAPR